MSDYGGDDGGFDDGGYEYVHGLSCAAQLRRGQQSRAYRADADVRQWRRHRLR